MFGFIEQWLAEILNIEYEPFTLNNGGRAAMLSRNNFVRVFKALIQVWRDSGDEEDIQPLDKESDIHGMRVIVHKYYKNDDVLDGLTTGPMKETETYAKIVELGSGNQRFSEDQFINDIRLAFNNVPAQRTVETPRPVQRMTEVARAEMPVEPNQAFEEVEEDLTDGESMPGNKKTRGRSKKTEETEESMIENIIKKVHDNFGWSFCDMGNGYKLCTVHSSNIRTETFIDLSFLLKKHIIAFDDNRKIAVFKKKDLFDQKVLEKHFLLIVTYPKSNTDFSLSSAGFRSLAFGREVHELYVVKGVDVNKEILKIKNNGYPKDKEEKEISEILMESRNSPYAKYDKIYKDTVTNVVVAIQDKNVVYLMFHPEIQNSIFVSTCFDEIGKRFEGKIPYDDLRKIDMEYMNSITTQNREEYVKFAVDNSNSIIKSLKQKFEEAKAQYEQYFTQALEYGKMCEKYMEQISSFDEKAHVEKMKQKAYDEFTAVVTIDKVESVIVKDEAVHVYTKNIYARDERTKILHDIGTFHIKIGMHSNNYDTQNTVIIRNTKHQISAFNNQVMQAPHVFTEGYICHGTLATGMANAYKKRDLYQLVLQLILFLGQANTDDAAGKEIDKWPIVDESILVKQEKEEKKNSVEAVEATDLPAADKYDEVLSEAITF